MNNNVLSYSAIECFEYSDYPYGSEPLSLPAPPDVEHELGYDLRETMAEHLFPAARLSLSGPARQLCPSWLDPDPVSLAWFRWIVAHQLTFLVWRHLGIRLQVVLRSESDATDTEEHLTKSAELVRLTTALLAYAATCTRHAYTTNIRPFMALYHSAFTARWAVDYVPVSRAYHALGRRFSGNVPGLSGLRQAFEHNRRMHVAVAKKLVPESVSLLQQHQDRSKLLNPNARTQFIYDSFFLVQRVPEQGANTGDSLFRRMIAVLVDLELNGFTLGGSGNDPEAPAEYSDPELKIYLQTMPDLLQRAAAPGGSEVP